MDAVAVQPETQTDCELVYIPPHLFQQAYPAFKHLLPSVIERSGGRIDIPTLVDSVARNETHIFTVWDGNEVLALIGCDVGHVPTGLKICTIRFTAGHDSGRWLHLLDEIEDWARKIGCGRFEMLARKGWARKLRDYKMTHVVLEKELA